ncbi:MAG: hypothetical protein MK209_02185 [Planctomycetes bacterium]|nr:hypothetical protein [Planctomycetota bacterium]
MTAGSWELGCKVNWTLEVLGRREDGFHELRSWFLWLDGGDFLSWQEGQRALTVTGVDAVGVPTDSSNLLLRADCAWRAAGGRAPSLAWTLEKRLPPGSGLGAGSADAAAVLQVLEQVATEPLGLDSCLQLAGQLGSDVPFFLGEVSAQLLAGRGEISLAKERPDCEAVVLALPTALASTPEVFAALGAPDWPGGVREAIPFPTEPQWNQLEGAAIQVVPALAGLRDPLRAIAPFQLSGSGSAWFCSQPSDQAAEVAAAVQALGIRAQVHKVWAGSCVGGKA